MEPLELILWVVAIVFALSAIAALLAIVQFGDPRRSVITISEPYRGRLFTSVLLEIAVISLAASGAMLYGRARIQIERERTELAQDKLQLAQRRGVELESQLTTKASELSSVTESRLRLVVLAQAQDLLPVVSEKPDSVFDIKNDLGNVSSEVEEFLSENVSGLVKLVGDPDVNTRNSAIIGIARVGPEAVDAIPQLITSLGSEDKETQALSAVALHQIGRRAMPELLGALASETPQVRSGAAVSLALFGPHTSPVLVALLADEDPSVRFSAACALGSFGEQAENAIPAVIPVLREALSSADQSVRIEAVSALGKLSLDAKSAMSALKEAKGDTNEHVRAAATEVLNGTEQSP